LEEAGLRIFLVIKIRIRSGKTGVRGKGNSLGGGGGGGGGVWNKPFFKKSRED